MIAMLYQQQKKLALKLFDLGAVLDKRRSPKGKGFRLKLHEKDPEAPLSPFYLNFRTPEHPKNGPLTPEVVSEIGEVLHDMARSLKLAYTRVAGVPRAGDPLASAFCSHLSSSDSLLRFGKQDGATDRRVVEIVEGSYAPRDIVLLIDDLITKATSKCEAIRACSSAGLNVRDVLVLVDRGQGGREQLAEILVNLHAVFTIQELFDLYLEAGRVDKETHQEVIEYLTMNR